MSEYIRVLKRIQDAQRDSLATLTEPNAARPREAAASQPAAAPHPPEARSRTRAAYSQLYDQLRLSADTRSKHTYVLTPVSGPEPVSDVAAGLAAHIEHHGYHVLRAELGVWDGRPVLRRRREAPLESLGELGLAFEGDLMPVDLSSATAQAELAEWIEGASRVAEIVIIEARPLCESIDAGLMARACDGLILVAQPGVTERRALHLAAERARAAGCRTLGVVLYGTKQRLPDWIRRILDRPRPRRIGTEG